MFMTATTDNRFGKLGFKIGDRVACDGGDRFYATITGFDETPDGELLAIIKTPSPFRPKIISIEKIWKPNPLKGID